MEIYRGERVLSFDEWYEINHIQGETESCLDCGGSGEHTCDCGDTHTCQSCWGKGKVKKDSRPEYEKLLRVEVEKLTAWRDGKAICHPLTLGEEKGEHERPAVVVLNIPKQGE